MLPAVDPGRPAILNLITTMEPEGAQNVLLDTIRMLDRGRFRIIVGFLKDRGTALREFPLPREVEVVDYTRSGRFDPLVLFKLISTIRSEHIALVHTHLVHAGILGKTAAKLAHIPSVTTRHYASDAKEESVAYRLENRLTRGSAAVIAVSASVADYLCEHGIAAADRITVIPNGVDLMAFDPNRFDFASAQHDEEAVIGCAGRLRDQKGHAILLAAFERILHAGLRAHLEIAGIGPLRDALEQRVRDRGLSGNVVFLGAVNHAEMPALLARWDLFVMPSLWEGFGLAAAEAMAMERPVVASRVEGLAEVVADGTTGLLVPPNDPDSLAAAIVTLMASPDRRKAMGKHGRETVLRLYNARRMAETLTEVYEHVLQRAA